MFLKQPKKVPQRPLKQPTNSLAARDTINFIIEEDEYNLVKNTPKKELPLLIGTLQFEYNNELLESRLKEK
jgi:hypothetical protein